MRAFANKSLVNSLAGAVLLFLYAPLLVMAVFSFNDSKFTGLPFNGFTLAWYEKVLTNDTILKSLWASVYVGIGVVILSVLIGLPAAIALDRYEFPGKTAFRRIVMLPIVLPGVITGVALLSFYITMGFRLSLYTIMLGQGRHSRASQSPKFMRVCSSSVSKKKLQSILAPRSSKRF